MIMNCLTMFALHRYRLLSWLGVCFTASLYLLHAWTILGSTGLLRLLNPTSPPLLSRRGGTMDGYSSSLQGPCLVDSSVARFVWDHVNYAQDVLDLWFDCGLPLSAHVDQFFVHRQAVKVSGSEWVLQTDYMDYVQQGEVLEAASAISEFSEQISEANLHVRTIAGIFSMSITWPLSLFRIGVESNLRELRDAQIQDAIISNPSTSLLDRARAALTKETILIPLAPQIARRVAIWADQLIPWADNCTTQIQKTVEDGTRPLQLLENDITLVRNAIASISRYQTWRIYRFFFGNPMGWEWFLRTLDRLLDAEKEIRHAVHVFEDVLDNLLLLGRYLRWYNNYSDRLLATFHRDDLKSFGDEVHNAAYAYDQLFDDARTLIWLVDEHPRDLVGTPVLNRRRHQAAIEA